MALIGGERMRTAVIGNAVLQRWVATVADVSMQVTLVNVSELLSTFFRAL